MKDEISDLRARHARMLERGPTLKDLSGTGREVAVACMRDEDGETCRWGRENLPKDEWSRIQEVVADLRHQQERAERLLAACRRHDVDTLRSMLPGYEAFFRQVASPPPFQERPVDAVVVIGISGNLIAKGRKILAREMAREALKVQVRTPGTSTGFYPNKGSRLTTERFFYGHYTPSIERQMSAPRPDCDRFKNSAYVQGACRRDLTVSIIRDWLALRGHQSVRFILSDQSAWPEYDLLFQRLLTNFDTSIDPKFVNRLSPKATFIGEVCAGGGNRLMWIDYAFYMRRLLDG